METENQLHHINEIVQHGGMGRIVRMTELLIAKQQGNPWQPVGRLMMAVKRKMMGGKMKSMRTCHQKRIFEDGRNCEPRSRMT